MITIGIDPGTNSTGVAIFKEETPKYDELIFSAQGKPNEMLDEVDKIIGSLAACDENKKKIFAVENMYPGPGKAGPKSIYSLGCVTGYIIGRCRQMQIYAAETWLWRPYPVSWRKHLVIPAGDDMTTMNAKNRAQAASMAVNFARVVSKDPMMGPRGGPQVDRAMAICIGIAAQIEFSKTKGKTAGVEAWMKISSG